MTDAFNVYHPAYLWMFRVTRNWSSVKDLVPLMRTHLTKSGLKRRFGAETDYKNASGTPIKDYHIVFRELFCVAAAELANDLNQPLENLGILYDEIIPTDQKQKVNRFKAYENFSDPIDLERDGIELDSVGEGQLLFLVRKVDKRESTRLKAAGYRFASAEQVIPKIGATLRIRRIDLTRYLDIMRTFAETDQILEPGVHIALFAVRASVSAGGFEILARKDARNLLPTMQLPINVLESWQIAYVEAIDGLDVVACLKRLNKAARSKNGDLKEKLFAKQLQTTLEALKDEIDDASFFNDARLIGKIFQAPCRGPTKKSGPRLATLISFRLVAAIQSRAPGKKLDYTPLALFQTQQLVYKNSRDHLKLARQTYRDFSATLDVSEPSSVRCSLIATAPITPLDEYNGSPDYFTMNNITERLLKADKMANEEGLFRRRHDSRTTSPGSMPPGDRSPKSYHLGGIMVSRRVSVERNNIDEINDEIIQCESFIEFKDIQEDMHAPGFHSPQITKVGKESREEEGGRPYVDELLKITLELR
jgi:hypothetical protein